MDASLVAETGVRALLFSELLRPITEKAGPVGDYAAQTFSTMLATSLETRHA